MNKMLTSLAGLALVAVVGCSGASSKGTATASSTAGSLAGAASTTPAASASGVSTAGTSTAGPSTAGPLAAVPSAPASSAAGSASTSTQTAVPAEQNPPGDIPDNVAFVPYTNAAGNYTFTHPEGWSEVTNGGSVTFTDKLNGLTVTPGGDAVPPTTTVARTRDVPALTRTQPAFQLRSVTAVAEPAGAGVHIVYRRNSPPDPVTGRQYRDEVERYELSSHGRSVVIELFGPVGADNVDAYKTMLQSLRLS